MSVHSTYETLRQFADGWGLGVMVLVFLGLVVWPFRPGARDANQAAATMIFEEDDNG